MHPDDELPAGWLTQFRRGLLSGAGLLLLATGLCAIPAFVVWLVPGADSTPASVAVKAGALLALSAAHGGLVLDGTELSLTPLLVTLALGWLIASQARRADSSSAVLGLAIGYGLASGGLAGWARIGASHAPVGASMLAAGLFVLAVGTLTRAGQLGWTRLAERWRRVLRGAGAAASCYLLAAALLTAGMLMMHFSAALAVQRQLSPGAAGLPVALLGMAAMPNAMLAGVGYLTGPGFTVGSHTSVSVVAVSQGRLPSFPLLAALPSGRPATVAGMLAIGLLAMLTGWLVLRVIAKHDWWLPRLVDAALAAVLAGLALAALSALGSGNLGSGALRGIGEQWWAVGACATLAVLFGAAVSLAVEVIGAHRAVPAEQVAAEQGTAAAEQSTAAAAEQGSSALSERGPSFRLHAISGERTKAEPAKSVKPAEPATASTEPGPELAAPPRSRNAG